MKKEFEKINEFSKRSIWADIAVNVVVGLLVALVFLLLFNSHYVGFCAAMIVGFAKEHIDHRRFGAGGWRTWLDWLVRMAGGLIAEWIWWGQIALY